MRIVTKILIYLDNDITQNAESNTNNIKTVISNINKPIKTFNTSKYTNQTKLFSEIDRNLIENVLV